jgi:DNA-binding CsgD family transcriptional regulator
MKTQIKVINPNAYDYFTVLGKPKTKDQKVRDAIQKKEYSKLHDGQERPVFEASEEQTNQFNLWLEDYQADLNKIIGKYRRNNHMLTHEELLSEINIALLKKRSGLIEYTVNNGGFNQNNFKKSAFIYTRNLVKWSHLSIRNSSFVKRRDDGVFYDDEDGFKTSFEIAVDTMGAHPDDDPNNIANKDVILKYKDFLSNVKNYFDILSENEVKVLSMLEKSMTEEEISNKLGVTRQAVNYACHNIYKTIKSYISSEEVFGHSYKKIQDGNSSISNFFTSKRKVGLEPEHSSLLKTLVLNHKGELNSNEITKKLNKMCRTDYNVRQISTSLNVRKLSKFLRKKE